MHMNDNRKEEITKCVIALSAYANRKDDAPTIEAIFQMLMKLSQEDAVNTLLGTLNVCLEQIQINQQKHKSILQTILSVTNPDNNE